MKQEGEDVLTVLPYGENISYALLFPMSWNWTQTWRYIHVRCIYADLSACEIRNANCQLQRTVTYTKHQKNTTAAPMTTENRIKMTIKATSAGRSPPLGCDVTLSRSVVSVRNILHILQCNMFDILHKHFIRFYIFYSITILQDNCLQNHVK